MAHNHSKQPAQAKFDQPIPLLGLHRQRLGVVRCCNLALVEGRIIELALETRWQTIQLDASRVRYDAKEQVFVLR
ncbi:MAG: hypothetical protein NWP69_02955 [Congregibacter sp.]|nr:hypothetical protein [Congregibacter sp.]